MLTFDSVKTRLDREQPLSFLEFNYMILQAYDFVELNLKYNCQLQIGGSDQWGNIVNGVELSRRLNALKSATDQSSQLFGLTSNLLTTADGKKWVKVQMEQSGLIAICYRPLIIFNIFAIPMMQML